MTSQISDCESNGMCVEIAEYEMARDEILSLDKSSNVWMSSASTTYGMYSAVEEVKFR